MDRRTYLTTVATGLTGLAGCADSTLPESTSSPNNPWNTETITVGLERLANQPTDIEDNLEQTFAYWEQNSETYTGYETNFAYRPNTDNPNITIQLVETIQSCGKHTGNTTILGCAPIGISSPTSTSTIQILAGLENENLTGTLKHEFGHVLGLTHDDEPQKVMSSDPADRIPDYAERRDIINHYNNGLTAQNNTVQQYDTGLSYYNNEEFTTASGIFAQAKQDAEDGRNDFREASMIAREISEESVETIALNAETHMGHLYDSMEAIEISSEAYSNNEYDRGDTYITRHQEAHQKAQESRPQDTAIIIDELGL